MLLLLLQPEDVFLETHLTTRTGDVSLRLRVKCLDPARTQKRKKKPFCFDLRLIGRYDEVNARHRQSFVNVSEPGEVQKLFKRMKNELYHTTSHFEKSAQMKFLGMRLSTSGYF